MKNAYVTGANRGLGLALAERLLELGYNVFAGSYIPDCEELQDLSAKHGNALNVVQLDISDSDSVNKAAAEISKKTDSLNLLINNAGIAPLRDREATILNDIDCDEIIQAFDINAVGTLRVTKSVLPLLLKPQDKRLVNITSVAASVGLCTRSSQYAYTMSKAASNMQTKLIYNTFNKEGLKVFALHPGWMHTRLFGDSLDLMKGAPFEPEDSAKFILEFVLNAEQNDDHIFFNYDGTPMAY